MIHIPLPGGFTTVIDDEDAALVAGFNWRVLELRKGLRYVHAHRGGLHIYMHRLILGAPKGRIVDHRNGDGLDNRRANLRLATHSQNHANRGPNARARGKSSRYKGVYWNKARRKWAATIYVDGKSRHLGLHATEEAAAAAHDQAALAAWGEFAKTNGGAQASDS